MKRYVRLVAILFGLALMVNPAMAAITDPFTGGGLVVSGFDSVGNPWVTTLSGPSGATIIWGIPGIGLGVTSATFTGVITDFHFSTLPEPITNDQYQISPTSQSLGGFTYETRFENDSTSVLWNRMISADGFSVDFYAPSLADAIQSGTSFFVNIAFTPDASLSGLSLDDLYFTANYTTVPLPGAVYLLGSGLVGLLGYRGRKYLKS